MSHDGKTAFITGGTRGIGRATAEALTAAGMNVAVTARTGADAVRVAEELTATGKGRAAGHAADVRDPASLAAAVEATVAEFGGIDLLVANAGIGGRASVQEHTAEFWHDVIDTNLTGVYNTVKAALPALVESSGMIVTIGSLAGSNFFAGGAAYNASKWGLLGFTQAIMLDLRKDGVRVSTIMPGSVATTFAGREVTAAESWKIQPEDIASTVLYLFGMPARTLPSKVEVRPAQTSAG